MRLLNAIREWWQLRARLRDERRFHLDRAAAELLDCRYSRQSLGAAARELGCDFAGLVDLIRTHRAGTPSAILTVDIGSRWFGGDITGQDFAALQSMTTLTRVERYHGSYA